MVQVCKTNTTCVLPEECPKTPQIVCENNLVPTTNGIIKFCGEKDAIIVKNGCICPNGMIQVSKQNQTCVLPNQCPTSTTTCDSNMVLQSKGRLYYCGGKISDWMYHKCICKSGMRYDQSKLTCVLPGECTNSEEQLACQKSDPNKEYFECYSNKCYPTCDLPRPKHCSKECRKGCYCKTGYIQVSEADTRCVLPSECPVAKCKEHATLKECTSSCPPSCANMHLPLQCINLCEIPSRCECNVGYVSNSTNDCIRKEQCKSEEIECPVNMEYDTCHGCEKTCNDLNPKCTKQCRIGCFCKKGYVEHKAGGVCIPEKECSKPGPCSEDEDYVKCQNLCPNTCKNLFEPAVPCVEICKAGCDCKKGLVRNNNGKCVSPDECLTAEIYCPANMHVTSKEHKLETCQSYSKQDIAPLDVPKGCVCNEDLVYDQVRKECIEKSMCPDSDENEVCKRIDPHSHYSTFPMCPRTCLKRSPICNQFSEPGCECLPGYILIHDQGLCIEEKDCPIVDPMPCSINATYVRCRNTCPDDCINILTKKPRICSRICTPGCDCNDGYVLDSSGNCIKPTDCETGQADCKDPNALYTNCGGCHKTCSIRAPPCNRKCHIGCFCITGYVQDDTTGLCIPKEKCPAETLCPTNSTPAECVDTCAKTCSNMYQDFTCLPSDKCRKGCNCNKGLVLNSQGICVIPEQCKPEEISCAYTMHYTKIAMNLETCESYHSGSSCSKAYCICNPGFVYDSVAKTCIDPRLCPNSPENQHCITVDPNSVYILDHSCQKNCTDLSKIATKCGPDCVCKEGFVLAPNIKCVPYQECPIDCGENATYRFVNTCKRSCATYYINSNLMCAVRQQYGCDCLDGYVSTNDHQCVQVLDCPPEEILCPHGMSYDVCDRFQTCNDLNSGFRSYKAGCFCPDPYVYDSAIKLCVQGTQCSLTDAPMKCSANAKFKRCKSTCPDTCCNVGSTSPRTCTLECTPGCECINGYVLNHKGQCVQPTECSVTDCSSIDPNSEYRTCGGCQGTCSDMNPICTTMCHTGWFCKEGYTLDDVSRLCIPIAKCSTCPHNSTQVDCVDKCGKKCESMYHPDVPCVHTKECKHGCNCNKGFVINSQGLCVKPDDCRPEEITCPLNMHLTARPTELKTCESYYSPESSSKAGSHECKTSKCVCDKGQVYDRKLNYCVDPKLCSNSPQNQDCIKADSNSIYSLQHHCPLPCLDLSTPQTECKDGCVCKPGYVIAPDGKCIPFNKCPIKCPANTTYRLLNTCGRTCDTFRILHLILCLVPTTYGCDCNDGYVRNSKGQCILPNQCPKPDCSLIDPNSEYLDCGGCQGSCSNMNPICNKMCHQGCFCKRGYTKDDVSGFCILKNECLTCPQNSTQVQCVDKCGKKCESMYHPDVPCVHTKECKRGCNCNKGFVINSQNLCVEPEDCRPDEITCPLNMHLTARSTELKTCENYYSPESSPEEGSNESKKSRCVCDRGLVYDRSRNYCIDPKLCPNSRENQACQANKPHTVYALSHECERPCTDLSPYPGRICRPGCICAPGYVRGPDKTCIAKTECPVDCGPNATYSTYMNSCASCKMYYMADSVECLSMPQPGCNCNEGYLINSEGDCVLIDNCRPEEIDCLSNLHFEECTRARTCADLDELSDKFKKGCFCAKPLIYNTEIGKCVDIQLCPNSEENEACALKDINSEYSESHICEQPCDRLFLGNKQMCYNECVCKEGFLRNSQDECIKAEKCFKPDEIDCGSNATYLGQVYKCGHTCGSYHWRELIRCSPPEDIPGCNCKDGYVFTYEDHCVLVTDCPLDELSCPGVLHPKRSARPATCEDVLKNSYEEKTDCFCENTTLVYDRNNHMCVFAHECLTYDKQK